jgi:hypothetical protein
MLTASPRDRSHLMKAPMRRVDSTLTNHLGGHRLVPAPDRQQCTPRRSRLQYLRRKNLPQRALQRVLRYKKLKQIQMLALILPSHRRRAHSQTNPCQGPAHPAKSLQGQPVFQLNRAPMLPKTEAPFQLAQQLEIT